MVMAARHEHPWAEDHEGRCVLCGLGVQRDRIEAHMRGMARRIDELTDAIELVVDELGDPDVIDIRLGTPEGAAIRKLHEVYGASTSTCAAADQEQAGATPARVAGAREDQREAGFGEVAPPQPASVYPEGEHGPCRLQCGHEGTCWDGDHIWLREGDTYVIGDARDSAPDVDPDSGDWGYDHGEHHTGQD